MKSHAELLDDILNQFTDSIRQGKKIGIDEFLIDHEEFAEELRPLLESVLAVEAIKQERASSARQSLGMASIQRQEIGDYVLGEQIGRGGMGIVFLATQKSLDRTVALKILPPSLFIDSNQIERFKKEARTASSLQHENIVPIHDIGCEDNIHYFSMRRIEGIGLDVAMAAMSSDSTSAVNPSVQAVVDYFDGSNPSDSESQSGLRADHSHSGNSRWDRVANVILQAANAIAYAHKSRVLHRDLKPSNLIVEASGKTWVADFGIAKIMDHSSLTQTQEFLGTLQYAAPEQLDGKFDARSDVFGLGITLFELATLHRAFNAKGRRELAQQVRGAVLPNIRSVDRSIPRDLATIVATATSPDPTMRYQSAREFADDLDRFIKGLPIAARELNLAQKVWMWSQSNRALSSLIASSAVFVIVAAFAGWTLYWQSINSLEREQDALKSAQASLIDVQAANARTQGNLDITLTAMGSLFDQIGGVDALDSQSSSLSELRSNVVSVSAKDMITLEEMIHFYEQFAAVNSDNEDLQIDRARAIRRIGDANLWIGRHQDAKLAYERALTCFEAMEGAEFELECGKIHQHLATCSIALGDPFAAMGHFERGRETLESLVAETQGLGPRVALVETYNMASGNVALIMRSMSNSSGSRGPSLPAFVGSGPLSSSEYSPFQELSVALAESIHSAHPSPRSSLLFACSLRHRAEIAKLVQESDQAQSDLEKALGVLRAMPEEYRLAPDYRLELASCQAASQEFAPSKKESLTRSENACKIIERLIQEYPDAPVYIETQAILRLALANAQEVNEHLSASSESFSQATDLFAKLQASFPSQLNFMIRLIHARSSWARMESKRGNHQAACEIISRTLAELKSRSLTQSTLGRITFLLRFSLERTLAIEKQALEKAEAKKHL